MDGEGTHQMPRDRPRQRGQSGKKKKNRRRIFSLSPTTFRFSFLSFVFPFSFFVFSFFIFRFSFFVFRFLFRFSICFHFRSFYFRFCFHFLFLFLLRRSSTKDPTVFIFCNLTASLPAEAFSISPPPPLSLFAPIPRN